MPLWKLIVIIIIGAGFAAVAVGQKQKGSGIMTHYYASPSSVEEFTLCGKREVYPQKIATHILANVTCHECLKLASKFMEKEK